MNKTVLAYVIAVIIPLAFFFFFDSQEMPAKKRLKRFIPLSADTQQPNKVLVNDTMWHTIPDFSFTTQTGDTFTFEELSQPHQHEDLLWGSSAFNCAQLLIRQYHNTSNSHGNLDSYINELPAFVYFDDDEKKLHPCGEVLLSEPQLIQIRSQGIMTFASYRNKNAIRLFSNQITAINV